MYRNRNAKIVATLGPASTDKETIQALFEAGADVFRLNFSHGTHADHKRRLDIIRTIEREAGRPIGVLLDLQGPKLRLGTFANGPVQLEEGDRFRLDLNRDSRATNRAPMPHPEIFAALEEGTDLLVDDGRVRLRVEKCGKDFAETRVIAGGVVSDRKGVNVPDVVLPLSALTEKDRADLDYGLTLGIDWVALSFVQRTEDIIEIKAILRAAPVSSQSWKSRWLSAASKQSLKKVMPSWSRGAIWASKCHPNRCPQSRNVSFAPAARPASR